jgi:hypothetical protein
MVSLKQLPGTSHGLLKVALKVRLGMSMIWEGDFDSIKSCKKLKVRG